jgi:adenine-specific DNA-methyltransferase
MLDRIADLTDRFISSRPKSCRKSCGQFFTSKGTARFMAGMFSAPATDTVRILDPGAGSGILSAAAVESIELRHGRVKNVELVCYENNAAVLPLLESNVEFMKAAARLKLKASVVRGNYLLAQADGLAGRPFPSGMPGEFDWVIGNPPYFKLPKGSPEITLMREICYGAPNMYSLFAAMSLSNLRRGGEMVYIVPRSWTSGSYFSRFRSYLLESGRLADIHAFTSRSRVFGWGEVLQETMIVKLKKSEDTPSSVRISSSDGSDGFGSTSGLDVPYDVVVSGPEKFVHIVTSSDGIGVVEKIRGFGGPMPSIGLKMRTGLIVEHRNRGLLRNSPGRRAVPLFNARHLKDGNVSFPAGKGNEYISGGTPGTAQPNRNYLFVKRFTSKEERRRLQCAVYLADRFPEYSRISTHNKINFIDTIDGSGMSAELVYGLYTVLNSSLYDAYYRILNGSTQVNATEMNTVPMPSLRQLKRLGRRLMRLGDLSTARCDAMLEESVTD